MIKKLNNSSEFNKVIEKGKWLVDFSATWCGPCRMLEPVLEEFSKGHNVVQVDIEQFSDLAQQFGIMTIPTLIVFEDGELVLRDIGYKTLEQLKEFYE